jgi:DNA modification methylase
MAVGHNVQLYCGDCLDILPTLAPSSMDAIITDLPYGTTACKWDEVIPFAPMWAEVKRVIKPNGAIALFGTQPFTSALVMSNAKWFKHCWVLNKSRPIGHLVAKKRPMQKTEDIVVFAKEGFKYNPQMVERATTIKRIHRAGRDGSCEHLGFTQTEDYHREYTHKYPTNIIECDSIQKEHPTQKSVEVIEYLIRTYTNESDTVLDFTMGSGTTGVACVKTGRNFIGIEKDQGYFEIAQRRIAEAQAQPALLEVN